MFCLWEEKSVSYLSVYRFSVSKMDIFNLVREICMDRFLAKIRNG